MSGPRGLPISRKSFRKRVGKHTLHCHKGASGSATPFCSFAHGLAHRHKRTRRYCAGHRSTGRVLTSTHARMQAQATTRTLSRWATTSHLSLGRRQPGSVWPHAQECSGVQCLSHAHGPRKDQAAVQPLQCHLASAAKRASKQVVGVQARCQQSSATTVTPNGSLLHDTRICKPMSSCFCW
jgi:hypothetical protein